MPVERVSRSFKDLSMSFKVNQQYARMLIHSTVKEDGYEVQEEWEMDAGSIELTVTCWTP